MGNGVGKVSTYQEIWNLKAYRLEEKIDRLEGELRKLRTELDERPSLNNKQHQKVNTPVNMSRLSYSAPIASTGTHRGMRRLSSRCEADSGGSLIKRRGSVVFSEKLLKAELEKLRMENDGLNNQLAEMKQPGDSPNSQTSPYDY